MLARYFTNLEFNPGDIALGRASRRAWTCAAYAAFCAGIFSRQLVAYPKIEFVQANMTYGVAGASCLVGIAVFPVIIRWFNRLRTKASVEHLVFAYSSGFFIDLTATALVGLVPGIHK